MRSLKCRDLIPAIGYFLPIVLLSALANSAPIPATSSSDLIGPNDGVYRSNIGFKIHAKKTGWELTPPPSDSRYIVTMYRAPEAYQNVQASLTVRLDRLKESQAPKKYVKKWLKQYPRFGFEVLGAKSFKSGGKPGYVVDLVNRENQKQLRQVVFVKDTSAIVMTCRDHIDNFRNSLKACNNIVRSFEWTDVEGAQKIQNIAPVMTDKLPKKKTIPNAETATARSKSNQATKTN